MEKFLETREKILYLGMEMMVSEKRKVKANVNAKVKVSVNVSKINRADRTNMNRANRTNPTNPVLSKYEKSFDNTISILLNSRKGLKPQAVFDFIALSQFSGPMIEQLLKKTIKTFTNYKEQNTLLDAVISEKILKLFALYDKGISVFGSVEEFNKWMGEAVFGLGYQVPREVLDTITGIDLVGEELTRIEYGDLA